ncbi:MAG TPA: hypothetical protein VI895_02620 [Bdellovibrionota bacterium]|nr:hypothetical protein [Bdellovibrionota bacterium]
MAAHIENLSTKRTSVEERNSVIELGGDLLQGYLFAKPNRELATLAG